MERIQFYPPEILKRVMLQDAKINGISISQLTVDILMEHYGLAVATENKKALSEIIDEVIDEVKTFVKDHPAGTTFDLLTASETHGCRWKTLNKPCNGWEDICIKTR